MPVDISPMMRLLELRQAVAEAEATLAKHKQELSTFEADNRETLAQIKAMLPGDAPRKRRSDAGKPRLVAAA